jgi:peptidoglycan/LPS O-acetylase OafA/YrhL
VSSRRTIAYQPALDGVRALAVAAVLAFHGGASWMTGGYVGVSVFFTLSGYLITSLLLVEHDSTGTVALGPFYARRMKRLLPASLVCLALVLGAAALGAFDHVTTLRRDALGALLQVANWVKLFGDASYADLTNATLGRVGPLEHYWSLAIEEQFYWVWPLVVRAVLRRTTRPLGPIAVMTAVAVAAAPVIAGVWGPDAAYWATPARLGEILVGALLAAVLHRGVVVPPPAARHLAAAGLVVIGWAAVTWPSASGPAYSGWLPVFALASVALILGLQQDSPVRRALSVPPLVWLGTISYGVYLFHWPVFALLTADRVGGGAIGLTVARLAITLVLAVASARFVERPVRRWSPEWGRPLAIGGAITLAASAIVVVAVQPAGAVQTAPATDLAPIQPAVPGALEPLAVVPSSSPPSSSPSSTVVATTGSIPGGTVAVPAVTRPVRIIVVGDSTATFTAAGLSAWAVDHPASAQVTDASEAGCGLLRSGTVPTDGSIDWTSPCREALDVRLPAMVRDLQPDVAMVMVTMRDVEDRSWSDDEGVLTPFDPRFRERMLLDYRAFADALSAQGVDDIAWVLAPVPIAAFQGAQRVMLDPARYEVQFDVIRQVAAERPGAVSVVDLNGWLRANGHADDASWRPDGLHWSPEAAYAVAERYVAGSVMTAAVED